MKNQTTINRVYKAKNFIQLDNALLQNRNLTFAAKGLLSMVLSLPSDWVVYMEWIYTQFPEGKDKVRTIVNELRANGYARFTQLRDEKGRMCGASWDFSEEPIYEPDIAKSPIEEKPLSVKPQLQTHSKQTRILNNNDEVVKVRAKKGEGKYDRPTWCFENGELVARYRDKEGFYDSWFAKQVEKVEKSLLHDSTKIDLDIQGEMDSNQAA